MSAARFNQVTALSLALILSLVLSGCSTTGSTLEPLTSIELGEPDTGTPGTETGTPGTETGTPGTESGEVVQINPVFDELAELEIEDQSGLGFEVKIEEVRLSLGDGFLVITNQEGEVLGYSVVTPDSQPVVVPLSLRASFSQELTGVLYLDNGDGVFSPDLDFPIRDDDGDGVRERFSYTVSG